MELPLMTLNGRADNFLNESGRPIEQVIPLDIVTMCMTTLRIIQSTRNNLSQVDGDGQGEDDDNGNENNNGNGNAGSNENSNDNNNDNSNDNDNDNGADDGDDNNDEDGDEDGEDGAPLPIVIDAGVELRKVDAQTGRALAGALLEVRNAANEVVFSGQSGMVGYTARFRALPGTYTIREIRAPEGYIRSNETYTFTVDARGIVEGTLVIPNERMPSERSYIFKHDARHTDVPVQGALIYIFNSSGNVIYETESDANGRAWFDIFPAGDYSYREIEAPAGYRLNTNTYNFSITGNGAVTTSDTRLQGNRLTLPNTSRSVEIAVVAAAPQNNTPNQVNSAAVTENAGRGVQGAELEVRNAADEVVGTATTDEDGRIQVNIEEPGVYTVREINAAEGFEADSTVHTFEIDEDGNVDGTLTLSSTMGEIPVPSWSGPQTVVDNSVLRTVIIITLVLTAIGVGGLVLRKVMLEKIGRRY
jgi:hypothetical protein